MIIRNHLRHSIRVKIRANAWRKRKAFIAPCNVTHHIWSMANDVGRENSAYVNIAEFDIEQESSNESNFLYDNRVRI